MQGLRTYCKNGTKNSRVTWQVSFRSLKFFLQWKWASFHWGCDVWIVHLTWDCSKQHSPEHYQCKHVAWKTASYVKQIAAPIADLLLTLLYYLTMWFRGGCIRSNTFTGHLINGVINSWEKLLSFAGSTNAEAIRGKQKCSWLMFLCALQSSWYLHVKQKRLEIIKQILIIICFLAQSQSILISISLISVFFVIQFFPLLPNHPDYFYQPISVINLVSHFRKKIPYTYLRQL